MTRIHFLILSTLALLAAGCKKNTSTATDSTWPDDKIRVVATTTMLADLCRVIGGDDVHVVGLMGPEQDPHSYVSRSGDSKLMLEAQVIVANGLRLEGKLADNLTKMSRQGLTTLIVGEKISPDRLLAPQEQFDDAKDPHIWGDVALWMLAADHVAETLSSADAANAPSYKERAKTYRSQLAELDTRTRAQAALIPNEKRVLITGHDAFFYFGKAYGFEVRGVRGVSSAVESDLKQNAALVAFIKERGIRTIYAESTVNGKEVQAIARESGAVVSEKSLFSDALGAEGETATYLGMMRHNVNAIVEGLK